MGGGMPPVVKGGAYALQQLAGAIAKIPAAVGVGGRVAPMADGMQETLAWRKLAEALERDGYTLESAAKRLDEQAKEIASLKEELDAEMNKNVEAKGKLAEASAEKIFREVTEDLTETQKAKMKSLADGVEFEDAESFSEKLNTLKATYFPSEAERDELAEEGIDLLSIPWVSKDN